MPLSSLYLNAASPDVSEDAASDSVRDTSRTVRLKISSVVQAKFGGVAAGVGRRLMLSRRQGQVQHEAH